MSIEWRTIPAWPEYEASSEGSVRRVGKVEPMKPHHSKRGYPVLGLWRNGEGHTKAVHRLVCAAFHGSAPQPRMDVAHKNGDRLDNRPENLRWATRAENERDKLAHGRSNIGSRNGQAILTEASAIEIRRRLATAPRSSGMGARIRKGVAPALAKEYGVTVAAIRNIARGTHWRHV